MPLAQPLGIDPPGERGELFEGGDAERPESLEEPVQDVDGRARVVEGAVRGRRGRGEVGRQRGQLAVGHLVAGEQATGQDGGVDRGHGRPGDAVVGAGGLQEPEVERRVVRDEDRAAGELEEARQHRTDAGGCRHHHRGDPGEHADVGRDLVPGVHERLELAEHLPAADPDGADLGDRAVLRGAAGGLQVDDDERDVGQGSAQRLDRHLLVPGGGRAGAEPARRGGRRARAGR